MSKSRFLAGFICALMALFLCTQSYALPFNITPNGVLPAVVVKNSTAFASYFVQNNTNEIRNDNFVKYLPPNTEMAPGGCADHFNLAPFGSAGDTCILNLTISGSISAQNPNPHNHLSVCFPGGITCAGTNYPLNLISVNSTLTAITVSPPAASIATNSMLQYTATGYFSDGTTSDITSSVTWVSSDTSKATINASGMATAVSAGATTITASLNGITSTPVTLTIQPITLLSIQIVPISTSIAIAATQPYTATGFYSNGTSSNITNSVNWNSSDSTKATISSTGVATGVLAGTTNITATMGLITSNTASLTVNPATLVSIAITPSGTVSLPSGGSQQFTAIGTYSDSSTADITNTVAWSSSNTATATISASGLAQALSTGSTTISASYLAITSNLVTLNVTSAILLSITVSSAPVGGIPAGTTFQFLATGHYSDLSTADITNSVTWASNSPGILSIVASGMNAGLATGVTVGSTTITATSGLIVSSPSTPVTVSNPNLVSIVLTPQNATAIVPNMVMYTATGNYSDGSMANITNQVSWISSMPSVATIAATGVATTVSAGSTSIQASLGLISASTPLTVTMPSIPVLVSTGQNLLTVSTDGGSTWTIPSISGLPSGDLFNAASCTGLGSTSVCTIAGVGGAGGGKPLVSVSTNGGVTWTTPVITGLPTTGGYQTTACSGTGSQTVCLAAGFSNTGTDFPPLAVSTDGGVTWGLKSVSGATAGGSFGGSACSGNNAAGDCIAVGSSSTHAPLIDQSTNGGTTWSVQSISGAPATGIFDAASCSGNTCIAAGQAGTAPLLAATTDGGATWSVKTITGAPATGNFLAVSCADQVCVADGQNSNANVPIVAKSTDGGATWAMQTISGLTSGFFETAACSGSGATVVCALGGDSVGSPPLLAVSTNSTASWSLKSITGGPTTGFIAGASCTGNGSSAICIGGGRKLSGGNAVLLVISTNGGVSWATATITGTFTANILIAAASSAG
ncbi:MAG: hypothetical protein HKM04_11055 [Legionellales bacterium]|nr:hypothetical protein [Legionellales bacterium]